MASQISKVLIANRGEIAVRIIRTCREMGIATVAVFSEPDRNALHVRLADEAQPIGPAAAEASYLRHDVLIETALRTQSDAIHPGYGFLSENASFAEACARAGIRFIGPPPHAIRAMGDKTTARGLMAKAGVPMAPGTPDAIEDVDEAARVAETIGYPILIKAAAGGGGKGMRVVAKPALLASAMDMASREALSAFGDGRVYIEKYMLEPRHVEFQILADQHGNIVHLFERECSIQRRHQKVIEEAPSPVLDDGLRAQMGVAAVAAAHSCGYVSAGTVEFLVDRDRNFYFMEMNTRIQVEHPVTELITGIDLVSEQIRIANGERLRFGQDVITRRGHAIECRIYAEDPAHGFLPDPGVVTHLRTPDGPGVRVDGGLEVGDEVQVHYDPMIAKLLAWGSDRDHAIRRMQRALSEYEVGGVRTTIPFCQYVLNHEHFREGNVTTQFVDTQFDAGQLSKDGEVSAARAALAAALVAYEQSNHSHQEDAAERQSERAHTPWFGRRRFD